MLRTLLPLLLLSALPTVAAQVEGRTSGQGEFPGLQLLPPGSIVKGISLPRYENHRVTAHLMADEMEILSRSEVKMTGIRIALYSEANETTFVEMVRAHYDFRTGTMNSDAEAGVQNPRFTARGAAVSYNSVRQQGFLKGPVSTTINFSILTQPPAPLKK